MKSFYAIAGITVTVFMSLAMPAVGQSPATPAAVMPAAGLPGGVIVMWSGQLDAIPAGWVLCDGSDGTPDLRNRFVLGVGAPDYQGSTGGSGSHTHLTRDHNHQVKPPALRGRATYGYSAYAGSGTRGRYYTLPEQTYNMRPFNSESAQVKPESVSHLPPYYKLAFIMKR